MLHLCQDQHQRILNRPVQLRHALSFETGNDWLGKQVDR